jgi:hypothetical protein
MVLQSTGTAKLSFEIALGLLKNNTVGEKWLILGLDKYSLKFLWQ